MVAHVRPHLENTLGPVAAKNVVAMVVVAATEEERTAMAQSVPTIPASTIRDTQDVMTVVGVTMTAAVEVKIDMVADTMTVAATMSPVAVVVVVVADATMMGAAEDDMTMVEAEVEAAMTRPVVVVLEDATKSVDTRNVAERQVFSLVKRTALSTLLYCFQNVCFF